MAAGLLVAVLFMAALVYNTLQQSQVTCEVCMEFEGSRTCRTVSGEDRDTAISMGVQNACALLANGVTPGIQCGRTAPTSISCE